MHTTTNLLVATNFFGLSSSNIPNYKIYNHIYQFNILFKAVLYDLMDNFIYFSNGQFHIFKLQLELQKKGNGICQIYITKLIIFSSFFLLLCVSG